jgi:thiol-disulfide isomerase/thioredoxin
MSFTELGSPDDLTEFIQSNAVCCVTYSATWCGPCKRSKPELKELLEEQQHSSTYDAVPFGYVYEEHLHQEEDDTDDFLQMFATIFCKSNITAFPTCICFKAGAEVERVTGVKLSQIKDMISRHASAFGGESSK